MTSEQVIEHYAEVATGARQGQCAFDPLGSGYSEEELALVPQGAVCTAQGCGNPTALGELMEGGIVVDIGSGTGLDLILAARRVGPTGKVIGVEPGADMRAAARKHVAQAGLTNVSIRRGDASRLPVHSDSADAVLSNCVFALIRDDAALREVRRVLKPGSRFLFSDIFVSPWLGWLFALVQAVLGPFLPMLRSLELSRARRIASLRRAGFGEVRVVRSARFTAGEVRNTLAETGLPPSLAPLGRLMLRRCEIEARKV